MVVATIRCSSQTFSVKAHGQGNQTWENSRKFLFDRFVIYHRYSNWTNGEEGERWRRWSPAEIFDRLLVFLFDKLLLFLSSLFSFSSSRQIELAMPEREREKKTPEIYVSCSYKHRIDPKRNKEKKTSSFLLRMISEKFNLVRWSKFGYQTKEKVD